MCQCRMAYNMVVLMLKNVVWDKWMNDQLNSLWVAAAAVCVCHSIFRCYRYTLLLIQCLCVLQNVYDIIIQRQFFFVCPPTMKSCLFIVWIVVVNGDYFDDDDVFFNWKKVPEPMNMNQDQSMPSNENKTKKFRKSPTQTSLNR
mgnify:CR=1 FL=1